MIFLKKIDSHILLFVEDCIIRFNEIDGSFDTLKIPQLPPTENGKVTSVQFSHEKALLAVTLDNKQLIIYDQKLNILNNILTKRAVSKVTFVSNTELLVADKTGDVFKYNVQDNSQPTLLLGHLSVLLDITVTPCKRFIITCDRDEKIRVSHYPNAYNIASYCLGHKEFVTKLEIYEDTLLSASGDGSIRFWDYLTGKQLHVVETNKYINNKDLIKSISEQIGVEVNVLPITDMQVFSNDKKAYIGISLFNSNEMQIYKMKKVDENLDVEFYQYLNLPSNILAFNLDVELFVLSSNSFLKYELIDEKYVKVRSNTLNEFYDAHKNMLLEISLGNTLFTLYKRKYDNVKEYFERKKMRLENKP